MSESFSNRTVIVTGAGKGVGQATAAAFHDRGANVGLLDSDAESGRALEEQLRERAMFVPCNVAEQPSVQTAIDQVAERFGGIDVLVNNAGIQTYGNAMTITDDDWQRTIAVNLHGPYYCARAVLKHMQNRKQGVIINVASVQSFICQRNVVAYATSKSAILGLTRSIAMDFAPNIRCVAVCPGSVDTPMLRNALQESPDPDAVMQELLDMHPLKRIAQPAEVAELILYLASSNAAFITGQAFRIDGGLGIPIAGSKSES